MFIETLLRISGSWSLALLDDQRLATRTHMYTLADHILTLLFPLTSHANTVVASVGSARSCSRHLDPAIGTQPLRKLDCAGAVAARVFQTDIIALRPGGCAEGTEREETSVSDDVISFVLSEAMGRRIVVAGGADEVGGEV